ncbi:acyl-CoA thioesterase [Ferdinandcohnia quinoae]|uniref:Acyl-CoA thioesterase n=1 Tax=Fredinandcohnia quinoae TaxID=2918902 RepID=A0AAW5E340_9BACI|nr:acyl-CoA thioesterase [Fredinandcohnia sp. SECRCQ15]MCH1623995.1 acyl-CoA thioesterase [Fredinandcohnia sp. SECRCQ15]
MVESKFCKESFVVKTSNVFPPDTNYHGTLFGGKLMGYIDDVASIAATRHSRSAVVTASTDSVDFLHPIHVGSSVCLEAYVTYTGRSSMEVFVKVIAENLISGERNMCAISFLTFVALDENGKPKQVPTVVPQSDEEKMLHQSAKDRAETRKKRKKENEKMAQLFSVALPWEI